MTGTAALKDRTLHLVVGWSAVAVMIAEFVLIPMRSRVWFPAWTGTLNTFWWWSAGLLLVWVVVPAWLMKRDGPLPFSLMLPRTGRGLGLYAALIAVMIPALYVASQRPDFAGTYPLLRPTHVADNGTVVATQWTAGLLGAYWLCYVVILFSTEFLFRGVLLFSLESRLGLAAVGVSVLPYCLIHAHKPLPEAFGSIVAGYVLGYLAIRTRSIGGGVLVHCAVAIGMDVMALIAQGAWPM